MKTLKDLTLQLNKVADGNVKRQLKAEAVKEIKAFSEGYRDGLPFMCIDEEVDGILKYIKWKNNLTEEDLEGCANK